ncbi:hypothetical protein A3721_03900 [Sulfitobacter sp. HI0023]|nr:hypothetical protein A3721_03900 [Sulfitobacter sp. HI0023]
MTFQRLFVFVLSLIALALAVLISPERLASIGLMEQSLAHENPLVRKSTLIEIVFARWVFAVLGGAGLLAVILWPRLAGSARLARFMARDYAMPEAYDKFRPGLRSLAAMAGLYMIIVLYVIFGDRLFSVDTLLAFNLEDGVIENVSAVLLLVAAVYAAWVAVTVRAIYPRMALMHGFLALLFVVMCGEEISWGQRYLGIETPEAMRRINVQAEINFHNLFGYFFDHAFIFCFFLWGAVVPVLDRYVPLCRQVFRAIGLPIASAGLAIGMLATTLFQDQLVYSFSDGLPGLRVAELRELLSALAFLLMMMESRELVRAAPRTLAASH